MGELDDLDALPSVRLHDLAVRRAVRHMDGAFLWTLLRDLPAGEAIAGRPEQAGADAAHLSVLIADAFDDEDITVTDALRPLYLSYLRQHRADLDHLDDPPQR